MYPINYFAGYDPFWRDDGMKIITFSFIALLLYSRYDYFIKILILHFVATPNIIQFYNYFSCGIIYYPFTLSTTHWLLGLTSWPLWQYFDHFQCHFQCHVVVDFVDAVVVVDWHWQGTWWDVFGVDHYANQFSSIQCDQLWLVKVEPTGVVRAVGSIQSTGTVGVEQDTGLQSSPSPTPGVHWIHLWGGEGSSWHCCWKTIYLIRTLSLQMNKL